MGGRTRWALLCVVGLSLALGLTACTGFWQTAVQLPKLFVGPVTMTGTEGYVLVSVADMPDGGLASIQFGVLGDEAIDFSDIAAASIAAEGKNGFVVMASDFTTTPDKGVLLAVNGVTGIVGGEILKFTFTVTGANPTFTVTAAKVTLADDTNTFVTVWDSGTDAYYTK